MARKQLPPGTRWQRCRPDCGCSTQNPSRYDACTCKSGCLRGSADRRIRDDYALMVNQVMMGGLAPNGHLWCPITGHPFHWVNGHVDKIGDLYLPGKIVLVSSEGNLMRGILQARGEDMPGIARYVADIAAASSRVTPRVDGEITRRPQRKQTAARTVSGINALMSGPYGTR
jgi:hypothetical protein